MNELKTKGDIAELVVVGDLAKRGYRVALPFGDNWDYDIILCRQQTCFERVQVKYTESKGEYVSVRCRVTSVTRGKTITSKTYNPAMIDWLAVYDCTTDCCYYLRSTDLDGKTELRLRLTPTRNNQVAGILWAKNYKDI